MPYSYIFNIGMAFSFESHNFKMRIQFFFLALFLSFWEYWNGLWHRTKWLNLVSAMSSVLNWFYLLCEFSRIFFPFLFLLFSFRLLFFVTRIIINVTDWFSFLCYCYRFLFPFGSNSHFVDFFFSILILYHRIICLAHTCVKTIRLWSIFYWIFSNGKCLFIFGCCKKKNQIKKLKWFCMLRAFESPNWLWV